MNTVGRQVLRTFAVLVVLQVLTSFVGAWLLGRMMPAVDRILVENERSLAAVERMALALAEAKHASDARERFVAGLEIAEGNVTEEEERAELTVLRDEHERAFAGERRAHERVIEALTQLGRINRDAMERSNQEAQRLGLAGAWVVALFGVIGLIGSVIAVVRTRRRLVAPLRVLADVVTDHARGGSHRRCPRTQGGELGEVLGNVNELLERIERATRVERARTRATCVQTECNEDVVDVGDGHATLGDQLIRPARRADVRRSRNREHAHVPLHRFCHRDHRSAGST